jgi:hypothetical protein
MDGSAYQQVDSYHNGKQFQGLGILSVIPQIQSQQSA